MNTPSATATTAAKIGNGLSIPMHMKKEQPLAGRASVIKRKAADSSSNRLLNGSTKPAPQKKKLGIVGNSDWLQAGTGKRQPSVSMAQQYTKKKQRIISTLGAGGFDGSVAVPKPNRLFQSQAPMVMAKSSTAVIPNEPPREKILQKQLEVAQRLKEQAVVAPNASKSSSKRNSQQAKRAADVGSFLDSLNVDQEKVLKAKSRFASEANAEHYARQRLIVTELEKQEVSKEKSAKKAGTEKQRLTKEWICATCGGKKFSKRPTRCIASNHQVKFSRALTDSLSKTEQRTKLHDKTVDDGGLRLGAGLDWSRSWSRFS
jgi:minichromosome maintenance protein 10